MDQNLRTSEGGNPATTQARSVGAPPSSLLSQASPGLSMERRLYLDPGPGRSPCRPANHRIIVGEHDKSSNVENIQILYVEKAITHPLYDANTINNDILLLKLKEPAFFGDTVSPICLPRATDTFSPGTHAAVTGWGVTRWNANYGSSTLQQTVLPLISTEDCKKWWGSYIMDPMICAGANGHSTCMGDSGGPLTVQKDGMWVLAGLTSWGNSRCDTSVPVVYTRVTTFVDWIAETMAKN